VSVTENRVSRGERKIVRGRRGRREVGMWDKGWGMWRGRDNGNGILGILRKHMHI